MRNGILYAFHNARICKKRSQNCNQTKYRFRGHIEHGRLELDCASASRSRVARSGEQETHIEKTTCEPARSGCRFVFDRKVQQKDLKRDARGNVLGRFRRPKHAHRSWALMANQNSHAFRIAGNVFEWCSEGVVDGFVVPFEWVGECQRPSLKNNMWTHTKLFLTIWLRQISRSHWFFDQNICGFQH